MTKPSEACIELVRQAAANNGLLSIFELDAWKYADQIKEATKLGLLKQIGSGGWGVDDDYSLTASGAELAAA